MKFSIKNFFSKCDQIRIIFCAVKSRFTTLSITNECLAVVVLCFLFQTFPSPDIE